MSKPRPIGIDLGTTNSCVATIDEFGRTRMVRNAEGEVLTPSAVLFDDQEVVVGKEARRVAALKPGQIAEWVKRDMGSPVYGRPIRGQYLPPEVIQACILRKLKADAVAALGPELRAVITVPAYFDEPRRKATADAGEMAGLTVLDIVNEPTAAALAFGESLGYLAPTGTPQHDMTVAVYDLGGGTFDATLLRLAPGDIRTVATDGDVQLGGFDWDMRLLNFAAESFKQAHGADPRDDPAAWQRLYEAVVEAKHTLSVRARAAIRIDYAGRSAEVAVTREQFEDLTADLLERTAYTTRQLLAAAKLSWADVSKVLLVGGSTRMPVVPRLLRQMSNIVPDHTVNPDEAVARGAAIFANYLLARQTAGAAPPAFQVTDVNSHSLGIEGIDPETLRKTNVVLIPRNTPLPAKLTQRFTTKTENQRSIVVQVLEGESTLPSECNPVGRTVIRDLPAGLPKGWPVEVTFAYGSNGRLAVRAVVPGTQREVKLELEREVGLSNEGIARWKQPVLDLAGFEAFEKMVDSVLQACPPGAAAAPSPPQGLGSTPPPLDASAPATLAAPPAPRAAEPAFASQPTPLMLQPPPLEPLEPLAPEPAIGPGAARPPLGAAAPAAMAPGEAGVLGDLGPLRARNSSPRKIRRLLIGLIGYTVSAVVGLGAGYWLIRSLVPNAKLPQLW